MVGGGRLTVVTADPARSDDRAGQTDPVEPALGLPDLLQGRQRSGPSQQRVDGARAADALDVRR